MIKELERSPMPRQMTDNQNLTTIINLYKDEIKYLICLVQLCAYITKVWLQNSNHAAMINGLQKCKAPDFKYVCK